MIRYDMAYIGQVRNKKTKELHDFMDRSQRQMGLISFQLTKKLSISNNVLIPLKSLGNAELK